MLYRKGLIAIGLITFAFASLLMFPARVAVHWFVPAEVQLNGIGGTIWSGNAAEGNAGGVYFRDLDWSFKPLHLFLGSVAADVTVNTNAGRISTGAAISLTGAVTMNDLRGSLVLSAIHPGFLSNRIDGTVRMDMQSLKLINGFPTEAVGTIDVANLMAGALGPDAIGNFHADVSTSDAGIEALVEDAGAVVDLTGSITLSPNRDYRFTGLIGATPETPPSMNQNLRFLGSPDANGKHTFRFEGSL